MNRRKSERNEGDFTSAQRMMAAILGEASPEFLSRELCVALQSKEACWLTFEQDTRDSPRWAEAIKAVREGAVYNAGEVAAVPVYGMGERLGAICVAGRTYTPNDLDRLAEIAAFIGPLWGARRALTLRERELDTISAQLLHQAQIIDQIEDSIITTDLAGYITGWNGGAESLFGYTAEEAIGKHILCLYADEEDGETENDPLLSGGREMVVRRRKKSGEVFWASVTLSVVRDQLGNPTALVGYVRDISERLSKEEHLRLYGRIFENSGEAILITDATGNIQAVNRAFIQTIGYTAEEVVGSTPYMLRSAQHDQAFYAEIWRILNEGGHWQGELWVRHKNGDALPKWANLSSVKNEKGQVTHYVATLLDISERVAAEERIRQLAFYDTLTGLPNRATLYSLVEQALAVARRNKLSGALMFIDLDRFKYVNDTLGHGAGDELIRRVAARFKTCLRASDVIARLGGDEFVIALLDIAKAEDAATVARKILAIFSSPFLLDGHEISISASIGISIYPGDGMTVEDLIKHADIAMYRAKDQGRNSFLFYSNEMNVRSLEKLELESSLRRALDRNELLLHFQPQADIWTGVIVGAEVLVRWKHPELGMVSPGQFIPMAEETGLIVPIGQWVMDQAVAQNRAWQRDGVPIVKLAVNLSAQQFRLPLVEEVSGVLARHGLAHHFLELEITESMVMNNVEHVITMLSELSALSVPMSLDDFGTGYSSLSYLKRFPIDKLKIDQSFVRDVPYSADDVAITRAIIALGKSLGLKVIAEGVETREQLEFLREEGCDEIQGYLFSRPVPAEEFCQILLQGRRLEL
ncbi:MAG: EAL domain-containing protein [Methylophilaceae bacterium]|nr:EAL domain-containing protein [Methylophilaceae bacterium]